MTGPDYEWQGVAMIAIFISFAVIFLYNAARGCIKGAAAKYSFYAFIYL